MCYSKKRKEGWGRRIQVAPFSASPDALNQVTSYPPTLLAHRVGQGYPLKDGPWSPGSSAGQFIQHGTGGCQWVLPRPRNVPCRGMVVVCYSPAPTSRVPVKIRDFSDFWFIGQASDYFGRSDLCGKAPNCGLYFLLIGIVRIARLERRPMPIDYETLGAHR